MINKAEHLIPDILTVDELANLMRVDRRTVIGYVKSGKIPAIKIGRQYRIAKQNILYLFKETKGLKEL